MPETTQSTRCARQKYAKAPQAAGVIHTDFEKGAHTGEGFVAPFSAAFVARLHHGGGHGLH